VEKILAVKRARIDRKRYSMHGPSVARLVFEPQNAKPVAMLLQTAPQLDACRALLATVLDGRLALDPKLPATAGDPGQGARGAGLRA
jgi:hypothetical protein